MPRLRPSLFWLARQKISPHAPSLLQVCRDLNSTANELRWIKEHIASTPSSTTPSTRLRQLCRRRARGTPLQYVLGTQPFGDLELKCRSGVLIPRPETEAYTLEIASILRTTTPPNRRALTILDLCTGTGCIPLQLYASLHSHFASLAIHAVDVSPKAISLARENVRHNIRRGHIPPDLSSHQSPPVTFHQTDIFSPAVLSTIPPQQTPVDLLISNPPYISRRAFARSTARAVRNYEPRLALVPDQIPPDTVAALGCEDAPEDVFYARILQLCKVWRPRRVLVEVADGEQAGRVVGRVERDEVLGGWYGVEVWRDWPRGVYRVNKIGGWEGMARGEGGVRAVYLSLLGGDGGLE